jgi:hypothetical protein
MNCCFLKLPHLILTSQYILLLEERAGGNGQALKASEQTTSVVVPALGK